MRRWLAVPLFALAAIPSLHAAEEAVDLPAITRIREEGFGNSKVMDTAERLTDVLGPRLTGSPKLKEANEWARDQLASWGLVNARLEPWGPFGRGWTLERAVVQMVMSIPQTSAALSKSISGKMMCSLMPKV